MSARYDVAILGGGPAGTMAAITAANRGLKVVLLDENQAAGGQVYRAPSQGLTVSHPDTDARLGNELRDKLTASKTDIRFGRRVWLIEQGYRLSAMSSEGAETFDAETLIVATGALERHVPCPGWTLPGVVGLAAATVLLKSQKILPGRKVVVAGAGPLLLLVAAKILEGGGEVAAVIDANPRKAWMRRLPAMALQPRLLARGMGWLAKLMTSGTPILSGYAIRRFIGKDGVDGVVAGPVDSDWAPVDGKEKILSCDAVCYGFGLKPSIEAAMSIGAQAVFHSDLDAWNIHTRGDRATHVPNLYVCGDGGAVLGAAAAPLQGEIAALAAARDLGRMNADEFFKIAAPLQKMCIKAARFGAVMTQSAIPRKGVTQLATPDTIICRCENLTRETLDNAIAQGVLTINGLKSATRCGMGPCGGRVCEDAAAGLIAAATGRSRAQIGHGTARPPLRPVPLENIVKDFDYDALPFPEPAPL